MDTTGTIQTIGGAPAPPDTTRRHKRFDEPRWVMMRSLVIPGWGQWVNGSWLKALAVAGAEWGLGLAIASDVRELDRLLADVDAARVADDPEAELIAVNAYNDRQNTLIAREWLLGGVVTYALMDAYVDAHFRRFKVEFQHNRALPEGTSVPEKRTAPLESRVSVGWSF